GDKFFNLYFTVSNLQHGNFTTLNNFPVTQFTQEDVNQGQIQFVADGSVHTPRYVLQVQDRCALKSNIEVANIKFNLSPVLADNQLIINQGQSVILTSNNLNA